MKRWSSVLVPVIILFMGIGLRVADPALLVDFRHRVFDQFQVLKPRPYRPTAVKIVDVDEESLRRLGQWPWSRLLMARIVDNLQKAGAASIAFDIVFAESDRSSPHNIAQSWARASDTKPLLQKLGTNLPDYDAVFANSIAKSPVVLGFIVSNQNYGKPPSSKAGFALAGDDPKNFLPRFSGAVTNLPVLDTAASGIGTLNVIAENDNVVRRVPVVVASQGKLYPSVAMEALRVAQRASTYIVRSTNASANWAFGGHPGVSEIKVGAFVLPTDATGRVWLYDTGPRSERRIPAWQILEKNFDPASVAEQILFLGTSAPGLRDLHATPISSSAMGVEVQAQILEQILHGQFLQRPDWAYGAEILFLSVLGLALIFLMSRLGALMCAALGLTAIAAATGFSWYVFSGHGVLLDPIYPSFIVAGVYGSSSLMGYMRTESERKYIRNAFSHYLSPMLVERLAADPSRLKLGGEKRDLTLMFCDLRGFTTISEQYDAETLTQVINRFLTPMTDLIMAHGGTVDKYMGDCIMAFWNAPLDDPDHARHACTTALEMRNRLISVNTELHDEAETAGRAFHMLAIGIGLNSGECCVGNMGSDQRFDYSVLGDQVNLASRLEGQTKTYSVDIILGENTYRLAPDFAAIELDLIRVVGKSEAVRIYALLGDEAYRAKPEFQNLTLLQDEMLAAFRGRDWARARQALERVRGAGSALQLDLGGPCELYEARLDAYEQAPPPADWDGIFVSTSK